MSYHALDNQKLQRTEGKKPSYKEAEFSEVLMLVIMLHLVTMNSYW